MACTPMKNRITSYNVCYTKLLRTNMISYIPFIGSKGPMSMVAADTDVRYFILGSESVGQNGLLRFYVLHVVVLPIALFIGT